jgi:hypothetical protein
MHTETIVRASAFALVVAGTSILAAPQQTTQQAGQMTQGRVWIQNRGRAEAIPMDLRDVNLDTPLKVQVMNGDPGFTRTNPVQVTEIRKAWEYVTVALGPGDDITKVLSPLGVVGWETTGIAFVTGDKTTLLLKRVR